MITKDKQTKLKRIYQDINEIVAHKNVEKYYYQSEMKKLFERNIQNMTDGVRLSQGSKGEDEMSFLLRFANGLQQWVGRKEILQNNPIALIEFYEENITFI